MPPCPHTDLIFSPSPDASAYGYKRPTLAQRIAATTPLGTPKPITKSSTQDEHASTFPAPLVLPEDELSWDSTYPAQSLRSWIRDKDRNKVTPERRTIYLAAPPDVENGWVKSWAEPRVKNPSKEKSVDFPRTEEVLGFLRAFYHGMPVKMLPGPKLCFIADAQDDVIESPPSKRRKGSGTSKSRKNPINPETKSSQTLWLNTYTPAGLVSIRSRSTPNNPFMHQLNLNDLLDAAIEILPDDGYALLIIVEHDIYEDDDDDFACGRAYGGSRIAVVSGARYNPILDGEQGVEREHAWPASHCKTYVNNCCQDAETEIDLKFKKEKTKATEKSKNGRKVSPMHAALSAYISLPPPDSAPSETGLSDLWLGRVCRTASHELGHCLGIDHCVYYACAMQGTASVIEDARQPPYLCPIDLAKVLKATGVEVVERYQALLEFCEYYKNAHLFASYGAWIRERVGQESEHVT